MPTQIPEHIVTLSNRLIAASLWRRLPGHAVHPFTTGLKRDDYLTLINHASIFAFDSNPTARSLAYEIVTHALGLKDRVRPELVSTVDFLLARLGNFPGRILLKHRYQTSLGEARIPPLLRLEVLAREQENTVEGVAYPLTDFQFELFDSLEKAQPLSVSAPTSAGKSFVLSLQILRTLKRHPGACVVYVVPTRALIREVVLRVRDALTKNALSNVAVRCMPQPAIEAEVPAGIVYVLTQERLLTLLHAAGREFRLNLLVVDEAHGIRDGARGILLQTAIENALRRCRTAQVVFASPLIENPHTFLQLFSEGHGTATKELHSPVAQNFVLVELDRRNPTHLRFALLRKGSRIALGQRDLGQNFWTVSWLERRAQLAAAVTHERDGCLLYANGAWEAEQLAQNLKKLRSDVTPSPDVLDFIDYIKNHIHPEYALIDALKCGVAFHHGEMPASVRAGVEDLFRDRKLQFICCTSTLLQGVNLPARHLVVERPRRGNGNPLEQADFLNLAGRAGRLLKEFHGNVWCLNPDNWANPPKDHTNLPTVHPAFETTMNERISAVQQILNDTSTRDPDGALTATIGRLLTEFVLPKRSLDIVSTPQKQSQFEFAMETIRQRRFTLPHDIFARNSTVLPEKLENLFLRISSEDDLDAWIPRTPFQKGFYARMVKIFELLYAEIEGKKDRGYRYDANIAARWIHQNTLREIIDARLAWQKTQNKTTSVQQTIRDIIRCIERRLRFRWVRSLRAYHDVLGAVLRAVGRHADADAQSALYMYLECGASDPVVLGLISLGFSRTASLLLHDLKIFPAKTRPEQCREIILRTNLAARKIPAVVRREARDLLGRG